MYVWHVPAHFAMEVREWKRKKVVVTSKLAIQRRRRPLRDRNKFKNREHAKI